MTDNIPPMTDYMKNYLREHGEYPLNDDVLIIDIGEWVTDLEAALIILKELNEYFEELNNEEQEKNKQKRNGYKDKGPDGTEKSPPTKGKDT